MLEKVTVNLHAHDVPRPLPRKINHLLLVSVLLSTAAFIIGLTRFGGVDSLWTVPAAWFFTIIHHITIYVLSRRHQGPPPLPNPDETMAPVTIKNNSRTSVYHPAAKSASVTAFSASSMEQERERQRNYSAETLRDSRDTTASPVLASFASRDAGVTGATPRNGAGYMTKYPPFTLTITNCIVTCILAVIWTAAAIVPIVLLCSGAASHWGTGSAVGYFFRNCVAIPEAGIIWTLFALFTRARTRRGREGQFMRMDNW